MNSPLISVLMPVFNSEKFVSEAIQSILAQTYSNYEFIILNDGSTDSCHRIINSFKDSRIRCFSSQENIGYVRQLNRGLELARGDYIARMDSDDVALPHRFAMEIEVLEQNPQISVVGTWAQIVNEIGIPLGYEKPPCKDLLIKLAIPHFITPFIHPSVMIRRTSLLNARLKYDENFTFSEDADLWEKLSFQSKFHNIPKVLLKYRQHQMNVSLFNSSRQRKQAIIIAHRFLQRFLDREIPITLLQPMKEGFFPSLSQAYKSRKLYQELTRKFQKCTGSDSDYKEIKVSSARYVLEVYAKRIFFPLHWPHFFNSFRSSPLETLRFFCWHFSRKISKQMPSFL